MYPKMELGYGGGIMFREGGKGPHVALQLFYNPMEILQTGVIAEAGTTFKQKSYAFTAIAINAKYYIDDSYIYLGSLIGPAVNGPEKYGFLDEHNYGAKGWVSGFQLGASFNVSEDSYLFTEFGLRAYRLKRKEAIGGTKQLFSFTGIYNNEEPVFYYDTETPFYISITVGARFKLFQ